VYGAYQFNRLQYGREVDATPGTAVAATKVHRGPFMDIEDTSVREQVDEQTGVLADTGQFYTSRYGATLNLPAHPFTFEHGPIHFEAGITEGEGGDAETPYLRLYPFDVLPADVATKDIGTYTWESHNALSLDSREMAYSYVESFNLVGEIGKPWMIDAVWQGRQVVLDTFTPALSPATVEESMFANTILYIDTAAGTVGTTAIYGVMRGATINVITGIQPLYTPAGQLYFNGVKFVKPEITGTLTFELEGTGAGQVVTERAAYTARTQRQIKLLVNGANPTNNYWYFQAAVDYTNFGTYENTDGDTVVTIDWRARYLPAKTLFAAFGVNNTVAAYT
jgi:hypothetical protein